MTETRHALHVLILEDHPALARFLNDFVQELGHLPAGPVASMANARAVLSRQTVDAAFLDVSVEDGLVFPLADELCGRGVPFAFCTAFEDDAPFPDTYQDTPRLAKPFNLESVQKVLEKLMPGSEPPGRHH